MIVSIFLVNLFNNLALLFIDRMCRYCLAHRRERIDVGVWSDDGTRIQDRAAADFHTVAEHGSKLFQSGLISSFSVLDNNQFPVGLDIGGDGTRTHVRAVTRMESPT